MSNLPVIGSAAGKNRPRHSYPRRRGVPAYTFPANREDLPVLRIVCRNGFSHDLADLLLDDLRASLPELTGQPGPRTRPARATAAGWFLTRHAEVLSAVRDVNTFQSNYREPGVIVPEEEQIIPEIPEPRHGRVRRLVNAVLAHHKAMRVESFIRRPSGRGIASDRSSNPPDVANRG
jgi:cytochrome P450